MEKYTETKKYAGDVCEAKGKCKQLSMGELEKRKEIENRNLSKKKKEIVKIKKGNGKLVEMGNRWKWEIDGNGKLVELGNWWKWEIGRNGKLELLNRKREIEKYTQIKKYVNRNEKLEMGNWNS